MMKKLLFVLFFFGIIGYVCGQLSLDKFNSESLNKEGTLPKPLPLDNTKAMVTIGTGTSTTSSTGETPFGTYYHDGQNHILYLASELTAAGLGAGNITAIALRE